MIYDHFVPFFFNLETKKLEKFVEDDGSLVSLVNDLPTTGPTTLGNYDIEVLRGFINSGPNNNDDGYRIRYAFGIQYLSIYVAARYFLMGGGTKKVEY